MSAVHTHAGAHAAPQYNRLALNRLGLWLFFLSETMIFIILLTTRFVLLKPTHPPELNQFLGLIITGVLLLSSLTAYRAESAIAAGDRKTFLSNLLWTIIMGTVFLLAVVLVEWPEAPKLGINPQEGFGMMFFSMTGMHAFHVLTGVLMLGLVYLNGRRGAYSAGKYWGVESVVKYWHFVDLVWVFFYPALYLLK
jgi:cytochrome c oxidase subunit 3